MQNTLSFPGRGVLTVLIDHGSDDYKNINIGYPKLKAEVVANHTLSTCRRQNQGRGQGAMAPPQLLPYPHLNPFSTWSSTDKVYFVSANEFLTHKKTSVF